MAPIGQIVNPTSGNDALARARQRASLVPDCLVEAKRIANTVIAGWHGRRKRGIGESIREFFTGSVAARLAHRQHRSILVVPLGESVPDEQKEIWPE